jgi:hypothetical protein
MFQALSLFSVRTTEEEPRAGFEKSVVVQGGRAQQRNQRIDDRSRFVKRMQVAIGMDRGVKHTRICLCRGKREGDCDEAIFDAGNAWYTRGQSRKAGFSSTGCHLTGKRWAPEKTPKPSG